MLKTKPSGLSQQRTKVRHGVCGYRDTVFNLDSHVVP
jgi:hypothetical protein